MLQQYRLDPRYHDHSCSLIDKHHCDCAFTNAERLSSYSHNTTGCHPSTSQSILIGFYRTLCIIRCGTLEGPHPHPPPCPSNKSNKSRFRRALLPPSQHLRRSCSSHGFGYGSCGNRGLMAGIGTTRVGVTWPSRLCCTFCLTFSQFGIVGDRETCSRSVCSIDIF